MGDGKQKLRISGSMGSEVSPFRRFIIIYQLTSDGWLNLLWVLHPSFWPRAANGSHAK